MDARPEDLRLEPGLAVERDDLVLERALGAPPLLDDADLVGPDDPEADELPDEPSQKQEDEEGNHAPDQPGIRRKVH